MAGMDMALIPPGAKPDTVARGQERQPEAGRRSALMARRIHLPSRWQDTVVILVYLLGAFYVTARFWPDLDHRITSGNSRDYAFFQFVLSHAAHAVTNLENPFFNAGLNAPLGVNMMANTSMLGLSVPLIPVTLLFGPQVSFAVALLVALAATATAWYYFMRRHVTSHWYVAFVAAGFCGFCPGIVSQLNAHPNIAAQFMVPLIVSRVIRLAEESSRAVRHGVILGLMIIYQMFINEEILFFTALGCAIMSVTYLASRPAQWRRLAWPFLTGLSVAAALTVTIMAYPLWFQFFGPQHYTGPFSWAEAFGIDLMAYPSYASESIGGFSGVNAAVAGSASEQNAFYGWPLCLFAVAFGIALWRTMAVRLALVVGICVAIFSLGSEITINGEPRGPGPWALLSGLPLFDAIIVTRMAIGVAGAIAVILAVAADRVLAAFATADGRSRVTLKALASGALAAALIPVAPTPLTAGPAPVIPAFFTEGQWREYVDDGTVVPVPPHVRSNDAMNWLVATRMQMRVADGYFLGPKSETDTRATFGGPQRPTGLLLRAVAASGAMPTITEAMRQAALSDLSYWQADVLALGPRENRDALRQTVTALIGIPGEEVAGVWVWDVRGLT